MENKTTNHKGTIEKVSKHSGYFEYQVADILHSLAIILSDEIDNERNVKIKGIGTFSYKQPRRIQNYSYYSGKHMDKYTKRTLKFKPDTLMLNYLNKEKEDA